MLLALPSVIKYNHDNHFVPIELISLSYLALHWGILLEQSFTACMPLLTATNAFGLGRKHWSSQRCRLHHFIALVLSSNVITATVLRGELLW